MTDRTIVIAAAANEAKRLKNEPDNNKYEKKDTAPMAETQSEISSKITQPSRYFLFVKNFKASLSSGEIPPKRR